MPNPQNRNDRRKGEERSETLIIPHITKEMLETARRMAEAGASRAEIEQAISAMQNPPPAAPTAESAQPAAPEQDAVPGAYLIRLETLQRAPGLLGRAATGVIAAGKVIDIEQRHGGVVSCKGVFVAADIDERHGTYYFMSIAFRQGRRQRKNAASHS